MEKEIFKKSEIDTNKLIKYGFIKENNKYVYMKNILNNSFEIIIIVENNNVKGKIIDKEINEEYLSFRIENQVGEFVSKVRDEYISLLEDIKNKCTMTKSFIYNQSNRIAQKIKELYNDEPEFLWEDNTSAVFRNKNNKKWYGIIMNINKNKLDEEDKDVEVLNIKLNEKLIEDLLKKKGFYKAYHMNKKYWISIVLDDEVKDEEIINLIQESYNYTVETNEWVIPANPKYWDIINCFNDTNIIDWKQSKGINKDDIVYIYVGSPYSAILYKCQAIECDKESIYPEFNKVMSIKLIERYPKDKYTFDIVKDYDLKAIRGARRMPQKLIDKIKEDEQTN